MSAREAEVLQLVAEGLTDGQVAEKLYISPRTVGCTCARSTGSSRCPRGPQPSK